MTPTFLDYFSLDGAQALGLLSVFVVLAGFMTIGAALGGAKRAVGADLYVGWGVAVMAFVIGGAILPLPLTWIAGGLGVAALGAIVVSRRSTTFELGSVGHWPVLWRVLILAVPFVVLTAAMAISQWDEFSQWVPNALYLIRHDAFPARDLPASPSVFPAYPYGLPMVTFMASRIAGGVVENAGALFNLLLLLALAPLYVGVVRRGLGAGVDWTRQWTVAAFGILGVTVLSTTFVQKLVLTHYSDSATAVLLAVIGVLMWRLLEDLAHGAEKGRLWALAGQLGAVVAAFLFVRQTNLVLLVFVLGGAFVIALRDPAIRIAAFVKHLPAVLVPGLVVYFAWRHHVSLNIDGGEFSLLPREHWRLEHAFTILGRMAAIASKKGAYFAMMTAVTVAALVAFVRGPGSFGRLAVLAAAVFVGQTLFLWVMYMVAFGDYEGMRAASFWRYNTQLGLLGAMAAAYGLATLWRRHGSGKAGWQKAGRTLGVLALVLAVAGPVAAAHKLRFDVRPQKIHLRSVAAEVAQMIPEGSRVMMVDPRGNGFSRMILQYELTSNTGYGRNLASVRDISLFTRDRSAEAILKQATDQKASHVVTHESLDTLKTTFGIDLPDHAVSLLARDGGAAWRLLKAWPYPGYTDPGTMPD